MGADQAPPVLGTRRKACDCGTWLTITLLVPTMSPKLSIAVPENRETPVGNAGKTTPAVFKLTIPVAEDQTKAWFGPVLRALRNPTTVWLLFKARAFELHCCALSSGVGEALGEDQIHAVGL